MGDFNSRRGTQQDFISFNYNFFTWCLFRRCFTDTLVDEDTLQTLGISQNRTSCDTASNNNGNRPIDFCNSSSLYLINGRIGVDNCKGCFTTTKNSLVDYVIGSPYLPSECVDFEICDFNYLYSDIHRGIHFTLKSIINDQLSPESTSGMKTKNHSSLILLPVILKKLQFYQTKLAAKII